MSDLIRKLKSIPDSVYEQVGNDKTDHDQLCFDTALEAADRIEELEKQVEWQPIETAPKDGSRIIIYDYDERSVEVAFWGNCNEWTGCNRRVYGWCAPYSLQDEQGGYFTFDKATHWMPLPSPPKAAIKGDSE